MPDSTLTTLPPAAGFARKLRMALDMIKFEHSVFALPFALTGAMLALRETPLAAPEMLRRLAWIVVAMVGARSAAMSFNRIVDARIDAANPRTRSRHLPSGLLSHRFAWGFFAAAVALFLFAAAMLNPLCLKLAPLALGVVLAYSYTKRFTALCHLVLGFALGIAPAAAWIAITGAIDPRILWLTAAVTLWTAGFDIIYACQDFDFDRTAPLFSIPKALGIARALTLSRLLHIAMAACLAILWAAFGMGWIAAAGIALAAALLIYEHSLVKPHDFRRVDAAFFTVNGWIGVLFLVFWAADVWFARPGA
ncbi:MAG: UbiA-like polyprenyltransferase [Bryobacteraceae bacterium]